MSRSYARQKIKQALRVAEGDTKQASRDIIELCVRDHEFLLGLTEPFLRGIIGHALKGAGELKPGEGAEKAKREVTPKVLEVEEMAKATGLGADIVKNVLGSGGHKFGTQDRTRSTLGKKTKASSKHVDALRAIAEKSKDK